MNISHTEMPHIKEIPNKMKKNEIKPCYKGNYTRDPGLPDMLEGPETGLFHSQGR